MSDAPVAENSSLNCSVLSETDRTQLKVATFSKTMLSTVNKYLYDELIYFSSACRCCFRWRIAEH